MSRTKIPWAQTITVAGTEIPRLGLGTTRLLGPGGAGAPANREASVRLILTAYSIGFRFFDTADVYGPHIAEELIAEALSPYPPDMVLASKGGQTLGADGRIRPCGTPAHLRRALEGSLVRLRTDHIDLYQLHMVDPEIPIEQTMEALAEFRAEGLIREIGVSNVDAALISRARTVVEIASVQNQFSATTAADEQLLRDLEQIDVVFIAYGPLGGQGGVDGANFHAFPDTVLSGGIGVTAAQAALRWTLMRSPSLLPLIGTRSGRHLQENFDALSLDKVSRSNSDESS